MYQQGNSVNYRERQKVQSTKKKLLSTKYNVQSTEKRVLVLLAPLKRIIHIFMFGDVKEETNLSSTPIAVGVLQTKITY